MKRQVSEFCVQASETIRCAMQRLDRLGLGLLLYLDEHHRPLHAVTDGDIRRALSA